MPVPVSATRKITDRPAGSSCPEATDPAAARRVADRVRDEVRQDLPDPDGIDVEEGQVGGRLDDEIDAGLGGGRRERGGRLAEQDVRVGRLPMEGQGARLRERDRPEVVDEALQDVRLLDEPGQVGLVGGMDAVGDGLEVAAEHGQRRSQLVAHVGEQRPPLLLVRLESRGHRVEGPGQLAQLPGAAANLRDAGVVGAALNAPGGVDQR